MFQLEAHSFFKNVLEGLVDGSAFDLRVVCIHKGTQQQQDVRLDPAALPKELFQEAVAKV